MNEDIKELEEFIKDYETDYNVRWYVGYDTIQAIENLIKENKELSEKVTQNICNRVEAEVLEEYRLKVQNSISKDKIKELLNKYDKASFIAKVDLQELLEERN